MLFCPLSCRDKSHIEKSLHMRSTHRHSVLIYYHSGIHNPRVFWLWPSRHNFRDTDLKLSIF